MKTFTTAVISGLLNQVHREEISFSRMVEIMNERVELLNEMANIVNEMVSDANEPQYKDGDFVAGLGCVFILHKQIDEYSAQYHVLLEIAYAKTNGSLHYSKTYSPLSGIFKLRLADEAEKQGLLDALEKEGKRWNAEKLCVEDIPVRKFKKGDKVRIKHGVSSKTHQHILPGFIVQMDDLIWKELTVDRYVNGMVYTEESYYLHEGWLEPYVEELKKGDLAIFWDANKGTAMIGEYDYSLKDDHYPHKDKRGNVWRNAIKFESKEQYRKLLKGEI